MCKTPKSYHDATSYDRHAMEPHAMDWATQPVPYKIYAKDGHSHAGGVALPEVERFPDGSLKDVYRLKTVGQSPDGPDLSELSAICSLSGGLTARSRQGNGYFYFRSAPSAGALYPNELYVAAFDIHNLDPGIYHYGGHNRFLTRIRGGNFKTFLTSAIPRLGPDSAGVFFITGIFFRSAWKYRKRAYRYLLLDGGHLLENLRLAVCAAGYGCRLHHAFKDQQIEALLGVDASREGILCAAGISGGKTLNVNPDAALAPLPSWIPAASRVSEREKVYPEINDIHMAARVLKTDTPETSLACAHPGMDAFAGSFPINMPKDDPGRLNYAQAVFQRRSKRNFVDAAIDKHALNYLLWIVSRAAGKDIEEIPGVSDCMSVGCLIGNVNGQEPGFYLLDPAKETVGQVFSGTVMEKMASVCLDQMWLKNAAVHFEFMTHLEKVNQKWGARGYRYAMLTAGRLGHAVYLAATALGLGCCGIGAFYDNEARKILGIDDTSAMVYLLGVGKVKG